MKEDYITKNKKGKKIDIELDPWHEMGKSINFMKRLLGGLFDDNKR